MSFPRYPEYKDSGVAWLGEVPGHWEVQRIKNTTYLKGRVGWKGLTSDEYLDEGYAYLVTGTDFSKRFISWSDCHCVERDRYEDDPFIQLKNGDLLITKDGTIGKLALVRGLDRPACLNSGIFLVRPENSYITEYMYWVLSSHPFSVFCDLSSFGSTIQHLYQNVFERFIFPIPSIEEQAAIAAFLDRETGKIDALVAEQEKLIALLKEKRQAVISHAVTKGLNPDAPMKHSGIEWLGEVPAHWDVKRIKKLASVISKGTTPTTVGATFVNSGVRFIKAENISDCYVNPEPEFYISEEAHQVLARSNLMDGDVLVVIAGATTGKSAVIGSELLPANTNQAVCFIRPLIPQFSNLIRFWLTTGLVQELIKLSSVQSAQPNLSMEDLGNIPIPIPSVDEQTAIAAFLDRETAKLDALTAEAQRAIELLKERRSALISAAVTGKIDVRKIAVVGYGHAA